MNSPALHPRVVQRTLQSVIYYDRANIVLQKRPGLVCQLQKATEETLGYKDNLNTVLQGPALGQTFGQCPVPVHRLDKGTTGILVLARSQVRARQLSRQFQDRTVEKTYLALVRGGKETFSGEKREIHTSIEYNDGHASLSRSGKGRQSFTEWELVNSSPIAPLSLLRLKLHTGNKHQLRIHLAHGLKAPILGDTLYSMSQPSKAITDVTNIPEDRMFLHASHISFFQYRHSGPRKRFRLGITAPLPADFLRTCQDCGIKLDSSVVEGGVSIDGTRITDSQMPEVEGNWMPKLYDS